MLYPEYTVTTPFAGSIKIPKAFPVPKDEEELTDLLEIWISVIKKNGTIATVYNYWHYTREA